jgi:hypothetical protein
VSDLLLNDDNDLDISTGDLQIVTEGAAVAQRLGIRFRSFLGEWFLDTRYGFPWFESVLGIKNAEDYFEFLVRSTILSTPGVQAIVSMTTSFNKTTREFTVNAVVQTDAGERVVLDDFIAVG